MGKKSLKLPKWLSESVNRRRTQHYGQKEKGKTGKQPELGQKTSRCESLRALLHYVEWDRFVTLAGAKAD
jgi:hypothetical protein